MRIQRLGSASRLNRRRRAPRLGGGCLPIVVMVGFILGLMLLSINWIEERFNPTPTPGSGQDLIAARQAFAAGDLDHAVAAARQAYNTDPTQVQALPILARALVYRSYADYNRDIDRQLALQITSGAIERAPNTPDVMAAHAFALQANDEALDAYLLAQRALVIEPSHTFAQTVLALSLAGVGGFDNALRQIEPALIGRSEWRVDALRAKAIILNDLGRFTEAEAAVRAAIERNDNLLVLYFERAAYAMRAGDHNGATLAYFQIFAQDADNIKARLRMCEISSTLREPDTALDYCREVVEMAPSWADGWYRIGREYFLQGDYEAAQRHLNRCARLQVMQDVPVESRHFECWYMQGQAAENTGDCPALLATYNEFREMTAFVDIPQTWVYPPEGPPGCQP